MEEFCDQRHRNPALLVESAVEMDHAPGLQDYSFIYERKYALAFQCYFYRVLRIASEVYPEKISKFSDPQDRDELRPGKIKKRKPNI